MANWTGHSNLESFLRCTTPTVPSLSTPKTCFGDLYNLGQTASKDNTIEYFTLRDLWDQFYEWSAYGVGAPIRLKSGETVTQYYVPYLSAIQIYISKSLAALRNVGEDSETDSWSDDSESEKLSRSWDAVSDDSGFDQEGLWPTRERLGHLYFQYFESCGPYGRIPLMDKVIELAQNYPGLTSFKSTELSPASWMSVAWVKGSNCSLFFYFHGFMYSMGMVEHFNPSFWYPIYHIPALGNVKKDLSACFLTYHTISPSFQDNSPEGVGKNIDCTQAVKNGRNSTEASNCTSLPPFGLATYKMQGDFWINPKTADHERVVSLYSAADSWLKQLKVQHHDFNYFSTH